MKKQNFNGRRFFNFFFTIFSAILFVSCFGPRPSSPSGTYSSTVPHGNYVMDGYHKIVLESNGGFYVTLEGDGYTIYGKWSKIENGVVLSLSKNDPEFNSYNGEWKWTEHNNGKGVGEEGMVLKKQNTNETQYLFPL